MNNPTITFRHFYGIWYARNKERMGLSPAKFHKEVFDFLLNNDNWENNTGVLQVFRSGAKSTIISLLVTYLLVKDPSTTIIVQSADDRTARKVLGGVQELIRTHPLAVHLAQTEKEWQKSSFFVSGAVDALNASVTGFGIKSNITGRRAHWMIYDDVEAKGNANTEEKRLEIIDRVSEGVNILHPGGKRLFVGTPHTYDTLYNKIIKSGASSLTIPMLRNATGKWPNMKGDCVWPERFDDKTVRMKQNTVPEHEWMSQNMLVAWNMRETILDPNSLVVYDDEIEVVHANNSSSLRIAGVKMLSVNTFWDVSSGKTGRDNSVLSVVFTGENGHYYIHRAVGLKGDIDVQCEKIKEIANKLLLPSVTVETNGVGVHAVHILRKHLEKTGISVLEAHQSVNKKERIINAYQASLSGGYIHCHSSVYNSPFRIEMREFSVTATGQKDDYIDSVASALLREPVRINAGMFSRINKRIANWGNYSSASKTSNKYNPFNHTSV